MQADLRALLPTQSVSLHAFLSVEKSSGEWPSSYLGPIRGTDWPAAQPPRSGHQRPAFPLPFLDLSSLFHHQSVQIYITHGRMIKLY